MSRIAYLIPLLFLGCASTPPPVQTAGTAPTPPLANPVGLRWVRGSAEYRAITIQTYKAALASVERLSEGRPGGSWAVSVDADETILDNSQFEKEFFENPATPMKIAWPAWVKRRQRPPVPGAMTFLTGVRKLGGKVAVVSNTAHALCPDVAANLESTGLPYDILLCRQESDPDRKEGRWKRVTEGTAAPGTPPLDLLVWVGDNVQDFPDQSQALRREPESSFSDFGVRFFALPNPLYGTWEKNPLE